MLKTQHINLDVSLEPREIRLVRFASGVDDGDSTPLRFEMRRASLVDDDENYAALSYVWGDQSEKTSILINETCLHVGRNLHDVLLQLHRPEQTRLSWLWIDAICIDQLNMAERVLHVTMMGEIYSRAELVYVWLGPACETSDVAMDFISRYGPAAAAAGMFDLWHAPNEYEQVNDYVSSKLSLPREECRADAVNTGEESQHAKQAQFIVELLRNSDLHVPWATDGYKEHRLLSGMENLMQREYWSRIWTFQELTLAKQSIVLCGTKAIDIEGFEAVLGGIAYCVDSDARFLHPDVKNFGADLPAGLHDSVGLASRRAYRYGSLRPSQIVYQNRRALGRPHYAASDPKDILFGLFGILSEEDRAGLKVDYTMSTAEVFSILTKMLLRVPEEDGRPYNIDCCVPREDDNAEAEQLPSWVPDWREVGRDYIGESAINLASSFHASRGLVATSVDFHNGGCDDTCAQDILVLRRHGCIADVVTEVMTPGKCYSPDSQIVTYIVTVEQWIASIRQFTNLGVDSGPGEDYVWRTVLLGYDTYGRRWQSHAPVDEEVVRWIRMIFRNEHVDVDRLTEKQREYIRNGKYHSGQQPDFSTLKDQVNHLQYQVPRDVEEMTDRRTLFKMRNSMLGMGHLVVREGDVVALLEGVRSPVILRHRPDGGYVFRGDAYVDGIMQGEFMQTQPAVQVIDIH